MSARHFSDPDNFVRSVISFLICAAVTLCALRQVMPVATTQVPVPEHGTIVVPMFNTWTMLWNSIWLTHPGTSYWNAPIFHPHHGAFAFSEPQPITLLLAPLFWMNLPPALAYNLYIVTAVMLNGYFATRLLRRLDVPWISSITGGVLMVLHPMVHAQLDVAQLIPLWPSLWLLTCLMELREYCDRRSILSDAPTTVQNSKVLRKGLETGIAAALIFASAIHHGLFMGLLLIFSGWLLVPWTGFRRWMTGLGAAGSIALLMLAPLLIPVYSLLREYNFTRNEDMVQQLSATWDDLLRVAPQSVLSVPGFRQTRPWYLLPGVFRSVIAVLAVVALRNHSMKSHRHPVLFLFLFGGVAALCSLGNNLIIGEWKIWPLLCDWGPGFRQVRSAFRFGYFLQLAMILLSAFGLAQLEHWARSRYPDGRLRVTGLLLVVSACLVFENVPRRVHMNGIPDPGRRSGWQQVLENAAEPGASVLILPYAEGFQVEQFDNTVRWMMRTTKSGVPLVNGYSGFFPASHYQWQSLLSGSTISSDALKRLWTEDVRFIVTMTPESETALRAAVFQQLEFKLLVHQQDAPDVRVFQLQPLEESPWLKLLP